jgi:hypothetical protein
MAYRIEDKFEIYYFCIMNIIEDKKEELFEICEKHKVESLYAFGSVLTDKFQNSSDIDLLVLFCYMSVEDYFDNYLNFKDKLEILFQRPVDLLEEQAIRNPIFRKVVDREKQLVYDRKGTQIFV